MSESTHQYLYVVHGSESSLLKPITDMLAEDHRVIRIFGKQEPSRHENCIDLQSLDDLGETLVSETRGSTCRVIVLGAAARSQRKFYSQLKNDEIEDIIETNVASYASLMSHVLPVMIRARYGRMIYLSSVRSQHHVDGATLYSASKAFGEKLFTGIGTEYGRLNITATTIRMGFFEGRMAFDLPEDQLKRILSKVSLRRLGNWRDLLQAIEFAIENPFTNGGVIELHGGFSCD